MAELTQEERDGLEFDLEWEKKEKKRLLICTAVCSIIGFIIGLAVGISEGDIEVVFGGIFGGIWLGAGVGGAISYLPVIPHTFKNMVAEEGCFEGIKSLLIGVAIWVIIFTFLGALGFLIRFLMANHKIKKIQNSLDAAGA